jgi:hypothetical protein
VVGSPREGPRTKFVGECNATARSEGRVRASVTLATSVSEYGSWEEFVVGLCDLAVKYDAVPD